jgi:hypothetical protein
MSLISYIDLKMKMIPIWISCIPYFSNNIPCLNRSPRDKNFREMSIIRPDVTSICKLMFDRNGISPSSKPSSNYYITISDRVYGSSCWCSDIHSFMTPISDVPSIIIRRFPEYRIDTTICSVIFIFCIVCSYDPRKWDFTVTSEGWPVRKTTTWCSNLIKWIYKGSGRSALYSDDKEKKRKEIFFHSDFLTGILLYDNITSYLKICKRNIYLFL